MALRLFVLGATGNIGSRVLDVALSRGHRVTAFARSPHKITRNEASLSVIGGDPLSTDALARALPGHDAVLSSIGPPPRQALAPCTLMAESAASTVAAMTAAAVKRLVIVSAAVLFPGRGLSFHFFQWLLRHHARDLVAMEAVVRATPLDWTIGRPPRLVKTPDESYRWATDALPSGASSVSYRAVAAFLVDSAETQAHERQIVGLASGGAR